MSLRLGMVVMVLLTACSGTAGRQPASPAPVSQVSSSAWSPSVSPSTSPAWKGPACRLAAMLWPDPFFETQGGFIDAATGAFSPDPHSVMVNDPATGFWHTPDPPYLYGLGAGDPALAAASYDSAKKRWVPVPRQYVSPDGASYAYTVIQPGSAQGVHVVDVGAAMDRVVPGTSGDPSPKGFHYWIIGFGTDGIYLTRLNMLGGGGLWLLNPATAAIKQLSTDAPGIYVQADSGQAWWTLPDGADPTKSRDPSVFHQYLTGNAGQHAESWFERPGFGLYVLGIDSNGHAIVLAHSATDDEVWLLGTPNNATQLRISRGGGQVDSMPFKTAIADLAGWWIGSKSGVYLAVGGSLHLVSSIPAVVVTGCL